MRFLNTLSSTSSPICTMYIRADAIICVAGLQVKSWTRTAGKQPSEVSILFHTGHFANPI